MERETGLKACVVYGNLPPETRRQQARLFNDEGSGFDVLVASDAVGMGLNLNIRRVIFFEMKKASDKVRGFDLTRPPPARASPDDNDLGLWPSQREELKPESFEIPQTSGRREWLSVSQAKQIAGRAGRHSSTYSEGIATAVSPEDLRYLRECLEFPIEKMKARGARGASALRVGCSCQRPEEEGGGRCVRRVQLQHRGRVGGGVLRHERPFPG